MRKILFAAVVLSFGGLSNAWGASCLDEAATFAERICGAIQQGGSSSVLTASGQLSAEAKGWLSRFLGSGSAGVNGDVVEKKFVGVVQEQLGPERVDARKCLREMATLGTGEVCRQLGTCGLPEFGQTGWRRTEVVHGTSGWRGGGSNPEAYCNEVKASAIAARNLGGKDYAAEILRSSEEGRWTGPFGRHREYNFHCDIKLSWEPAYVERADPRCPVAH
jgi:hypothetical protein